MVSVETSQKRLASRKILYRTRALYSIPTAMRTAHTTPPTIKNPKPNRESLTTKTQYTPMKTKTKPTRKTVTRNQYLSLILSHKLTSLLTLLQFLFCPIFPHRTIVRLTKALNQRQPKAKLRTTFHKSQTLRAPSKISYEPLESFSTIYKSEAE